MFHQPWLTSLLIMVTPPCVIYPNQNAHLWITSCPDPRLMPRFIHSSNALEPVNDKNCYSNIYISPSRFCLVAVCKSGAVTSCPFYHMNDINVCLGIGRGGGGVPNWKNAFHPCILFSNNEQYVFHLLNSGTWTDTARKITKLIHHKLNFLPMISCY